MSQDPPGASVRDERLVSSATSGLLSSGQVHASSLSSLVSPAGGPVLASLVTTSGPSSSRSSTVDGTGIGGVSVAMEVDSPRTWNRSTPLSKLFDALADRACIDRARLRDVELKWDDEEWGCTIGSVLAATWYVDWTLSLICSRACRRFISIYHVL